MGRPRLMRAANDILRKKPKKSNPSDTITVRHANSCPITPQAIPDETAARDHLMTAQQAISA
jgi:hypothetical protein